MAAFIFVFYFLALSLFSYFFHHRLSSEKDFVLGNRSLNFWLTALSAHASDMSSWLFLAYPAMIFVKGPIYIWAAIGLVLFMYLNWQFVAPKIRLLTEKSNNLTLNSFFESRVGHAKGSIRLIASLFTLFFYMTYISAGLVSLGFIGESLFHLNYSFGIILGMGIIAFYVFLGGYKTVAWIDLFQGFFLLFVILFVPFLLLGKMNSSSTILENLHINLFFQSFLPHSKEQFLELLFISCGWGLGYFGQPHILTKFMGIKDSQEINKAKYLGISWLTLSLFGATLFGLLGSFFFPGGLSNPEELTLEMVKQNLSPFFFGLVLCSILAATTNVIAAQILVVASSFGEDIYKRFLHKEASSSQLFFVSRASVIVIAIIAFIIAWFRPASIYNLVLYSWSGLGSAFGPLLLASLYKKNLSYTAAMTAIILGGAIAALWPIFSTQIPPMIPGFISGVLIIFIIDFFRPRKLKFVKGKL